MLVYDFDSESWSTGVTDGRGELEFKGTYPWHRNWVYQEGMALACACTSLQRFLREPRFATLTPFSVEDLEASYREWKKSTGDSVQHEVNLFAVDPPFLSLSQGGTARATVFLASYDLNATVSVAMSNTPGVPMDQITLASGQAAAEVPRDGRAAVPISLTVDPSIEPGIYELTIGGTIDEFIQPSTDAILADDGVYSPGAGARTIFVEVTPPG